MSIFKIASRVFNISFSLFFISSLFLMDLSIVVPNFQAYFSNLYAQSIGQEVKMYFDNAPAALTPGTEFSVIVKLDSSLSGINAVQSDITYPSALLQLTGIDTSASAFPLEVVNTGDYGEISIVRGSFSSVAGSGLVIAKLNFKTLSTGSAFLQFKSSSAAVNSQTDSLTESPSLTLVIKSPAPSIKPSSSPLPSIIANPTPSPSPIATPSPTPSSQKSTIKIYAAGTSVLGTYPQMKLEIRPTGQKYWDTVQTFNNVKGNPQKRQFQEFTYSQETKMNPADVRIRFTNDWFNKWLGDRNLMVDKISIDGVDIQTERSSTYSTGTWNSNTGCSAGTKKSEWLDCNGYFEYR